MTVVDLFAGPGGWDIAARSLGIDPIGIESDAAACATRAAAGLTTVRARLGDWWPNLDSLDGLIASPPCPAFSAAGNRDGVADLADLIAMADDDGYAWDHWWPAVAVNAGQLTADGAMLAEPLAWIDRWPPRWIALEQVPPVLPFWEAVARWLDRRGYSTWAGILNAADYGVPQTRRRAFLLASADRTVQPPAATHAEYPQPTLFGECPRPWVSMTEALGWDGTLHSNVDQRPDGTRQTRDTDRPAPTLSTRSVGQWTLNQYDDRTDRHGNRYRPAPTIDQPAPTITTKANRWKWDWAWRWPATTVQGDPRIWPPGHRINGDDIRRLGPDEAGRRYSNRAGTEAIKVEPAEAAVLQSFPPCYPFQGTKTAQARQIGNAVPPRLAAAVLGALTDNEGIPV